MSNTVVSLYVVKNGQNKYFAGFNTTEKKASFVDNPLEAKKFSNKYDIKLRPDELLVELQIDLAEVSVTQSEAFRPHHRTSK